MIWSVYVPVISLILFFIWMLRITLRARSSLNKLEKELEQLSTLLEGLIKNRRFTDSHEYWLDDTFEFITRNSSIPKNPLLELINRFYAIRLLTSPDISAILNSIADRETDKLEIAREAPNNLLLLGIMGTVIGMVIALASFGLSGFGDESTLSVGRILSSMFIAFISTGMALFMSVSTRGYLEKVTLHQADILADIDSYAFNYLAPILLPKQDAAVQERLQELLSQQQKTMGESMKRSSATLDQFSNVLSNAEHVTQGLSNSLSENASTLAKVGHRISTDLNKVSDDLSLKMLDALNLMNQNLNKQQSGLEVVYRDMQQQVFQDKQSTNDQTDMLQQRMAETIDLLKQNNLELTKGLTSMSAHLAQQSEIQTQTILDLRQDLRVLSTHVLESQEEHQRTFIETVQTFLQSQFAELGRSLGLRRKG